MEATLLDLLDRSFRVHADQPAVGVRHDDGSTVTWTYRELDRRAGSRPGGCGRSDWPPATDC